MSFADILKNYRGDRSRVKMATLLDISPTYYSELERGIKLPSYEIINRIIEQSGKDANYWFGIDTDTPSSTAAEDENKTNQSDIATIRSMLQKLSDNNGFGFAEHLLKTINKNTSISQIIAVVAQLRAYLSELSPDELPKSDAHTISNLLAACQRIINDTVSMADVYSYPDSHHSHQQREKIIEDSHRY